MEINEEFFITHIIGYMKYKFHLYGLSKNIKKARKNLLDLVK